MGNPTGEVPKQDLPSKIEQTGQSGGINISGGEVNARDMAGHDLTGTNTQQGMTEQTVQELISKLFQSVQAAPPENRAEAEAKVKTLQAEMEKGSKADDSIMAKLIDGIVGLVPEAVKVVVTMFASPILGGIAGPVTKFVIDKISGK
jgi:hypothetical protein